MVNALAVAAEASAGTAGRAHLVLIAVLVLVALVVGFVVLSLIGVGIRGFARMLARIVFPGARDHDYVPSFLGSMWIATIPLSAAAAFIFSVDWLWIVTIAAGALFALIYACKDDIPDREDEQSDEPEVDWPRR